MTAILDESVPKALVQSLSGYDIEVTPFPTKWKGLKNGALLSRIEAEGFTALLTCDKNLSFQQSIQSRPLAVVVLPMQKLARLKPLAGMIAAALKAAGPGKVVILHADGHFSVE